MAEDKKGFRSNSMFSGPAFFPLKDAGLLLLQGKSKKEYLQRQTSNNLDLLEDGIVVPNILPNPQGRVLELFINMLWLDGIALITPPKRGKGILSYFEKRIFFNDDVQFSDESDQWAQMILLDPDETNQINHLLTNDPAPAPNSVIKIVAGNREAHLVGIDRQGSFKAYLLIYPSNEKKDMLKIMASAGFHQIEANAYERFRINNGIVGDGELSASYTPFELGLDGFVSKSKGCYTGQEVLARQANFDKISKIKVLIHAKNSLARGGKVVINDQMVGEISSAHNMEDNKVIALGVIKKNRAIPGQKITVASETGKTLGEIVKVFQ